MISNSTPLICLVKLNQLELLRKLFSRIIIPEDVKREVVIQGKPGFAAVNKAIEEKWIAIKNPKNNLELGIGKGENASINLARENKDTLIIDDAYAIKIANSFNIYHIRTTTIILLALKKKIINQKQAKEFVNRLIEDGYYITPSIYTKIMRLIDD